MLNLPIGGRHLSARFLVSNTVVYLLLLTLWNSAFAQTARDDVQLQILMVRSPGPKFDPNGQLFALQVTDSSGAPVSGAEVLINAKNGTITGNDGQPQGSAITYFTDKQGRVEARLRRDKAGVIVTLDVTARFAGKTGSRNFHFTDMPLPRAGLGLKVAAIVGVGAAAAAGAVIATRGQPRPGPLPPTQINIGAPTVRP
jgi:hypothetical protein